MENQSVEGVFLDDSILFDIPTLTFYASTLLTLESVAALVVNLYLLNCSRYLRRPIGVNLRLCVNLTAADAACALFYMTSNLLNVIIPVLADRDQVASHCLSLLIECLKLATFFESVFILLALALNHYVGIVYPLYRAAITPRAVKTTIFAAYVVPVVSFFALFSIMSGGFRTEKAFAFFSMDGCEGGNILKRFSVRLIIAIPFIIFLVIIVFLYVHIVIHMREVARNPLLKHGGKKKKRSSNRRLLITLVLLAGSAVFGWLPTILGHIVFCKTCFIHINIYSQILLAILGQVLNVFKLIVDAFIYASRLVEIRYSIWMFHSACRSFVPGLNGKEQHIPEEFTKYMSETTEQKSVRIRRNFSSSTFANKSFTSQKRWTAYDESVRKKISTVSHGGKDRQNEGGCGEFGV